MPKGALTLTGTHSIPRHVQLSLPRPVGVATKSQLRVCTFSWGVVPPQLSLSYVTRDLGQVR